MQGLKGPFDLALSPGGELYVTDPSSYRFVKLDINTSAPVESHGGPGSKPGLFNFPKGIAASETNIYVVDSNNCRIQVFDYHGSVQNIIGSIGSIGGKFSTPQNVSLTHDGKLIVSDTRNHRIQIFDGKILVGVIGELGDAKDQFRLPTSCVSTKKGDFLVLDSKHGLIKVFDKDYKYIAEYAGQGKEPGKLNLPQGMIIDHEENIWVADTGNHRIQKYSPSGDFLTALGTEGSAATQFRNPTGLAIQNNKLFVADNGNSRVQVITSN
jgi:DNA-binding beta-propeller fold protein YncE